MRYKYYGIHDDGKTQNTKKLVEQTNQSQVCCDVSFCDFILSDSVKLLVELLRHKII